MNPLYLQSYIKKHQRNDHHYDRTLSISNSESNKPNKNNYQIATKIMAMKKKYKNDITY